MRENIHRGKRMSNGSWVFGDLMTKYIHHKGLTIVEAGCIYNEVDPVTVGMYSTIPDKNGVDIYEWDIVGVYGYTAVVKFGFFGDSQEFHGWYAEVIQYPSYGHLNVSFKTSVVIGNVFDNPELLVDDTPICVTCHNEFRKCKCPDFGYREPEVLSYRVNGEMLEKKTLI